MKRKSLNLWDCFGWFNTNLSWMHRWRTIARKVIYLTSKRISCQSDIKTQQKHQWPMILTLRLETPFLFKKTVRCNWIYSVSEFSVKIGRGAEANVRDNQNVIYAQVDKTSNGKNIANGILLSLIRRHTLTAF